MRYFDYIDEDNTKKIFFKRTEEFDKNTPIDILKYALGAFLYIPATQYNMMYKSMLNHKGARPLAICLEDAIGKNGEKEAIENLERVLNTIKIEVAKEKLPLIFVRIRDSKQFKRIKDIISANENILTGILIPKADSEVIKECINVLDDFKLNKIYLLPIIESEKFIYNETKEEAFLELYKVLLENKSRILNVRIGLTDILGIFGIRRSKDFSIYENTICKNFINDVITHLYRNELDIPISGGVSELYKMDNEDIRKQYIKEIKLDKFHGLVGKTVIHPSQIKIVQAYCVVNYEDYMDAKIILDSTDSKFGVSRSINGERMNEVNPHFRWAKKIMKLAKVYGVLNEGIDNEQLLRF